MNLLSILIYLADVLPTFASIALMLGIFGLLVSTILIISGRFVEWVYYCDREQAMSNRKAMGDWGVRVLIFSIVMLFSSTFIPSKNTFYLIAASELGEVVVMNPEMVDIYSEIRKTILQELRGFNQSRATK